MPLLEGFAEKRAPYDDAKNINSFPATRDFQFSYEICSAFITQCPLCIIMHLMYRFKLFIEICNLYLERGGGCGRVVTPHSLSWGPNESIDYADHEWR